MNEERKLILEMLKAGTVTVEEAERLLAALAEETAETQDAEKTELAVYDGVTGAQLRPKRIVVCVTKGEKPVVNVRVPFSLARAGLKMGKTFMSIGAKTDPDAAQAFEALRDVDMDDILDSISDGDITLPYAIVDVDDDEKGEHVKIVLE